MERLTKRVGCGEAVPVAEGNICAPFEKADLCKTGIQGGVFGRWERHCNDTCVLGTIIDKLAAYEDSGLTPDEVASIARLKAAGRLKLMPSKKSEGFTLKAPYPLGMKFYVIMHGYIEEQVLVGYKYRYGNLYLISDCGERWVIGIDAWLTYQEAKDYQLEEIRKYNERRATNESVDEKK